MAGHLLSRRESIHAGVNRGATYTVNRDVKPDSASTLGTRASLKPLIVAQMAGGTTHKGREITGTIVNAGIFTGGMYFLMKDVMGRFIKVGVYEVPGASVRAAAALFPVGRTLSVQCDF